MNTITFREFADRYGLNLDQAKYLARHKFFPLVTVGKEKLINADKIDRWVKYYTAKKSQALTSQIYRTHNTTYVTDSRRKILSPGFPWVQIDLADLFDSTKLNRKIDLCETAYNHLVCSEDYDKSWTAEKACQFLSYSEDDNESCGIKWAATVLEISEYKASMLPQIDGCPIVSQADNGNTILFDPSRLVEWYNSLPALVSLSELSRETGLSVYKIKKLIDDPKFDGIVKQGKNNILIYRDKVLEWLYK